VYRGCIHSCKSRTLSTGSVSASEKPAVACRKLSPLAIAKEARNWQGLRGGTACGITYGERTQSGRLHDSAICTASNEKRFATMQFHSECCRRLLVTSYKFSFD